MTQRRSLSLGAAALPLAAPALAHGRPLRIIVPFPPGGAVDILGRVLAERLPAALRTPVVVENRGGAGGLIGADALAKGDRDGTMIGLISVTTLCAFPFMTSRLPFNPRTDLAPVTQITDGALLCVVNAEKARREGWSDFRRLVTWSRANPEQVKMGSSGTGTTSHINIEAINAEAGAKILHVPYRGGGPAITDLLAGTIDMMFDVMPALLPHVREGRFRALAVGSAGRVDYVPEIANVPSMGELLPGSGIDALNWWCVVAATGTPEPAIATMHGAIARVLAMEEVRTRLLGLTIQPMPDATPAAFGEFWRSQVPVWRELVEASGAVAE